MLIIVLSILLGSAGAAYHRPHIYPIADAPIDWHKIPESSYEVLHEYRRSLSRSSVIHVFREHLVGAPPGFAMYIPCIMFATQMSQIAHVDWCACSC